MKEPVEEEQKENEEECQVETRPLPRRWLQVEDETTREARREVEEDEEDGEEEGGILIVWLILMIGWSFTVGCVVCW